MIDYYRDYAIPRYQAQIEIYNTQLNQYHRNLLDNMIGVNKMGPDVETIDNRHICKIYHKPIAEGILRVKPNKTDQYHVECATHEAIEDDESFRLKKSIICSGCGKPIEEIGFIRPNRGGQYHVGCAPSEDSETIEYGCTKCGQTLVKPKTLGLLTSLHCPTCKDHPVMIAKSISTPVGQPPICVDCEKHKSQDQHEPGAKLDNGKNRLGLIFGGFPRALWQVGLVGTQGANKYSPGGWKTVKNGFERYTDAMDRHYLKENMGEILDPELTEMAGEDIYHAACVAWNALARLELVLIMLENENK